MSKWHVQNNLPSEETLFFEIADLEEQLAELGHPQGWPGQEQLIACRENIRYRKMLLAAIREGRPEAWSEYR